MNERWRVALAGLVAALAIPFLIVDSPAPAEGVETNNEEIAQDLAAPTGEGSDVAADVQTDVQAQIELSGQAVEIIVSTTEVTPDISRLADQAGTWGLARAQAIEDGRVDATFTPPPSNTDYSLLPVVNTTPVTTAPPAEDPAVEEPAPEPSLPEEEATETAPGDGDGEGEPGTVEPDPAAPDEGETPEVGEGEPTVPEPTVDPEPDVPPVDQPGAPAQVDGRVPPPSGGPTGAQWDALRRCESTHNYAAISPSGLYRGAYQFSQQTWDWVSGIHWPFLVGIDPIDAEPAWQDVMAYTLYAMRGWDQWPICGKNLL